MIYLKDCRKHYLCCRMSRHSLYGHGIIGHDGGGPHSLLQAKAKKSSSGQLWITVHEVVANLTTRKYGG